MSRPLPNFALHHLQQIHLQKLLGPSVRHTTAGGTPDVVPALGVSQKSSYLMHRLHIVIVNSPVALGVPWIHEQSFCFGGTFFFW